jgi:hypothetical protein
MDNLNPKLIMWVGGTAISLIVLAFVIGAGGRIKTYEPGETGPKWEVEYPTTPPPIARPALTLDLPTPEPRTIRFINKCDVPITTAIYYENLEGNWVLYEKFVFSSDGALEVAITKNDSFYYYGKALMGDVPKWEGDARYLTLSDNKTYGFYLQQMVEKWNPYDLNWNCQ